MSEYVIGITGASGSVYGIRLLQELAGRKHRVHVVLTSAGRAVMQEEIRANGFTDLKKLGLEKLKSFIKVWENNDFEAPFLSGTSAPEAVIVVPCSLGKLAAIANGISSNVLERAADVALKEKRQLILVVRETPLNLIHLENMAQAAKSGAQILPAMPAFYHHPETIDDLVNFVVGKILNSLKIDHALFKAWKKE